MSMNQDFASGDPAGAPAGRSLRRSCGRHLRDSRLLHLGDEDNGALGSMPDADQVKMETILGLAASLADAGLVETITDGHGSVRRGRAPAPSSTTSSSRPSRCNRWHCRPGPEPKALTDKHSCTG